MYFLFVIYFLVHFNYNGFFIIIFGILLMIQSIYPYFSYIGSYLASSIMSLTLKNLYYKYLILMSQERLREVILQPQQFGRYKWFQISFVLPLGGCYVSGIINFVFKGNTAICSSNRLNIFLNKVITYLFEFQDHSILIQRDNQQLNLF